ncbi:hypothetical protein EVAR_97328_1 [Eumeta japonica]|uniref:Uncharacterized protein n=1 Tax=Eumeta variegata TaxID=151549 RepID=A0A4C1X9L6_EUMVA|nr:hypothetical protein EVAR_97328_1 [Eumeta japonica]
MKDASKRFFDIDTFQESSREVLGLVAGGTAEEADRPIAGEEVARFPRFLTDFTFRGTFLVGFSPTQPTRTGVTVCGIDIFYTLLTGLMMEPEGKHRNSIMKQRILAVFGLVEIVLRCTLTMNDFQGLMMQLEGSDNGAGSLEAPSSDPESQSWSKSISGQFQQAQICGISYQLRQCGIQEKRQREKAGNTPVASLGYWARMGGGNRLIFGHDRREDIIATLACIKCAGVAPGHSIHRQPVALAAYQPTNMRTFPQSTARCARRSTKALEADFIKMIWIFTHRTLQLDSTVSLNGYGCRWAEIASHINLFRLSCPKSGGGSVERWQFSDENHRSSTPEGIRFDRDHERIDRRVLDSGQIKAIAPRIGGNFKPSAPAVIGPRRAPSCRGCFKI